MRTFAHVETGVVQDPASAVDADAYRNMNRPMQYTVVTDPTANWDIRKVPDGTKAGATPDGQGGWVISAS